MLSNLLPGEQGMESPRGGWRSVVQVVPEGRLPPGCLGVQLPLLEGHPARLQELGQSCPFQLEGELDLFYFPEMGSFFFFNQITKTVWEVKSSY